MKNIIIAQSVLEAIDRGSSLFGRGGIQVHTAGSSEEMLDLHRRIKADLIITEFSFPVMGGVRLCSAIRGEPGLKDVSLVMYCDDNRVFQAACRDAGANAVIPKPVDPFDLYSKVAELIIVPQRKEMRVLLRVSVAGREQEISFIATSYNISMSGMLLETKHEVLKGDTLRCEFSIAHTEIMAQCMVMRVDRTAGGRFRYGVKFLNLDTRTIVIIEQYVKSRIRQ